MSIYHLQASAEGNGYGYGGVASPVMEMGNAADFSCAFSATTGFEVSCCSRVPI